MNSVGSVEENTRAFTSNGYVSMILVLSSLQWNVFGCPGAQFLLEEEDAWRPNLLTIWLMRVSSLILLIVGIALMIALGALGFAIVCVIAPFFGIYLVLEYTGILDRLRRCFSRRHRTPFNPRNNAPSPRIDSPVRHQRPVFPRPMDEDAAFNAMIERAIQESLRPEYNPEAVEARTDESPALI